MHTTHPSLLERLREPADQAAWSRFVNLYTPFIYYWARREGLQPDDASDLVQEVFLLLVKKLPEFRYDTSKSFRSWLRTVILNKWREMRRRREVLVTAREGSAPPEPTGPDTVQAFADAEYTQWLVRRALEIIQSEFEHASWKACWECLVVGRATAEVAEELGMTVNAVYIAKCRVLRRLREELDGLLE